MSRRTCANRSGSLAGWLAESNRIFCHTTWIRRLRTLTPLYLLYFSFASLSYFFYIISRSCRQFGHLLSPLFSSLLRRHSPALRFLLTLSLPSTHALILNSLLTTFVLSCPCSSHYPYHLSSYPVAYKSSTPSHVYKRSLNTKGCVLRHSYREGCWQGPRHYQSKTSKLLGLAERRLGIHRRCARSCCLERGLGRSRRAWYDYALRDHHPQCRVHVPFL